MVREARDRVGGIIDECGVLIQGVIGANAPMENPGDGAPREGNAPSSTHERESVNSVGN
mgnify:CR=1 FL=1